MPEFPCSHMNTRAAIPQTSLPTKNNLHECSQIGNNKEQKHGWTEQLFWIQMNVYKHCLCRIPLLQLLEVYLITSLQAIYWSPAPSSNFHSFTSAVNLSWALFSYFRAGVQGVIPPHLSVGGWIEQESCDLKYSLLKSQLENCSILHIWHERKTVCEF